MILMGAGAECAGVDWWLMVADNPVGRGGGIIAVKLILDEATVEF
jgi:hypothetical protein